MKRLIPVLAIALILVLTLWSDAFSRRYAPIRKEQVNLDHPWGGESQGDFEGPIISSSSDPVTEYNTRFTFRGWLQNWFFNSIYYLKFKPTEPEADRPIIIIDDGNSNNQNSNQGGTGR